MTLVIELVLLSFLFSFISYLSCSWYITQFPWFFYQSSQEEAIKQKDVLATEVSSLRGELQQVRDERDRQLSQVQTLSSELEKVKEYRKHSSTELDSLTLKANDLEVGLYTLFILIKYHTILLLWSHERMSFLPPGKMFFER